MAQPKRPRPAFSPPRPGKSTSKSKASKSKGVSKATSRRKSQAANTAAQRAKHKSSTRRHSTHSDDEDEDDDDEDDDDNHNSDRDAGANEDSSSNDNDDDDDNEAQSSAEEPDYILAEVTHDADADAADPTSTNGPAVSLPLIHRIMQEHWTDKDRTKMSTDARVLVGKFVEVFVREAIMRSSLERGTADVTIIPGSNEGWLEMEDLERIAPQLCLDF